MREARGAATAFATQNVFLIEEKDTRRLLRVGWRQSQGQIKVGTEFVLYLPATVPGAPRNGVSTVRFDNNVTIRTDVDVRYRQSFYEPTYKNPTWKLDREDTNVFLENAQRARSVTVTLSDLGGNQIGTTTWALADINALIAMAGPRHREIRRQYLQGQCRFRDCFVTTACCDAVGLSDDCWELQTARRFRDTWLAGQPTGPRAIAQYYTRAPGVVDYVSNLPDADQKLLRAYAFRILPFCILAALGANRWAFAVYRRMLLSLVKEARLARHP